MAWLLIILSVEFELCLEGGGMREKEQRPNTDERLKGKVAVEGVLRCLSELRQVKKEPATDTEETTQTEG